MAEIFFDHVPKRASKKQNKPVCAGCGKVFTPVVRKEHTAHPNLFGGVDVLCASCIRREDEKANNMAP